MKILKKINIVEFIKTAFNVIIKHLLTILRFIILNITVRTKSQLTFEINYQQRK